MALEVVIDLDSDFRLAITFLHALLVPEDLPSSAVLAVLIAELADPLVALLARDDIAVVYGDQVGFIQQRPGCLDVAIRALAVTELLELQLVDHQP